MMAEPMISCENLVKIYKVDELEVLALQGLDLTVQPGELMALVGASGSGKTTLMNVLGGLTRPSAGRVLVDGNDLLKLSDAALDRYRRREVGFVWQLGSRNLISYLNAQQNVEMPMALAGVRGKDAHRHAAELLEMVGLADRRHHRLSQLSGGEQQRVAIAVALANHPAILLADEPTGEVDTHTAQTIYAAFQRLNRELGLTILIVSHDPDIARYVGRVMAIRDGKTAVETVRTRRSRKPTDPEVGDPEEDEFEDLVVLDSAGRLQVPKAYREALDIQDRVRMELTGEGILIRPVAAEDRHAFGSTTASKKANPDESGGRLKIWLKQLRKKP